MRALLLTMVLATAACGDDSQPASDTVAGDTDASAARSACLDRPGELERAPSASLPCNLLPPGLELP